jgi:hypothetical protein
MHATLSTVTAQFSGPIVGLRTADLRPSAMLRRPRVGGKRLRQVDFVFDGNEIRGLEQNLKTKSRWAQMARSGKKVMQFLSESRYLANVVDGKVALYGRNSRMKPYSADMSLCREFHKRK